MATPDSMLATSVCPVSRPRGMRTFGARWSKCQGVFEMCKAQVKAVKLVLQTFGALRAVANHGNNWSIEHIL